MDPTTSAAHAAFTDALDDVLSWATKITEATAREDYLAINNLTTEPDKILEPLRKAARTLSIAAHSAIDKAETRRRKGLE
jgi:hypothetical protein